MYSMTGYGRAEYSDGGITLLIEIKTVNNRNFDFNAKMPRAFISLEDKIRKTVAEYISRARIDLFLNFYDKRENSGELTVNFPKLLGYKNAADEISKFISVPNDCTTSFFMKCPDVVSDAAVLDVTGFEDAVISTVKAACENLNEMRKAEGEKLISDMLSRMETIKDLRNKISERAPFVAREYKEKLKKRIEEALSDVKYDESRLLNEVAFFTDKSNIDEELTRLSSHIQQFVNIINTEKSGKKLDFLMQEFNRETNTICSKSNDLTITNYGLMLKNEIEKVREQVQNIE